MGTAATNKPIDVIAISIDRIVDHKIAEEWVTSDVLGMWHQLRVVPAPTQRTR